MLEIVVDRPELLPYQELDFNVWLKNVCAGCRACISVCPAGSLAFDSRLNRPQQVTHCVDCKVCLDACPRMPANARAMAPSDILGTCLEIRNVRSREGSGRFQKGGAATALLTAALE